MTNSKTRGVYIVANGKVAENAIALLASIRAHDPDVPVYMIPFNDDYQNLFQKLNTLYQVQLFPDLEFLEAFTQKISDIFPRDFLALPNKMRKLAAWFGPLDEFLYVDTDILFFEPIGNTLAYLDRADFICCDYHFKGRKLRDVFSPSVIERGIFPADIVNSLFNSGLWGSKKGTITLEQMYARLGECAQNRDYFDFSGGTTDQPVMNYLVLNSIDQRLNITQVEPNEPGSWGGMKHFVPRDHVLYDGDTRLRYLHWAGTPMRPGGPYRDLWEYYRYLDEPEARPPAGDSTGASPQSVHRLKTMLRRLTQRIKR
ncbi:Npun_R2821/Npun_R2822 family protein [Leptothoe kymatousa]|uniref:Methionine synthase n=1 Tax=Leptothoe kymatousa TAU-MAC 1615 TaxID=2364775 RepID=A0ABS5Y0W4_9CYAN|nr:Npun_R2821/Npun_R2822 family protein [Leptothoe kymatousa]MBT9311451.1 methionine synthase [Leptothoe kymatousa TAU-MAC 1615]